MFFLWGLTMPGTKTFCHCHPQPLFFLLVLSFRVAYLNQTSFNSCSCIHPAILPHSVHQLSSALLKLSSPSPPFLSCPAFCYISSLLISSSSSSSSYVNSLLFIYMPWIYSFINCMYFILIVLELFAFSLPVICMHAYRMFPSHFSIFVLKYFTWYINIIYKNLYSWFLIIILS